MSYVNLETATFILKLILFVFIDALERLCDCGGLFFYTTRRMLT